MAADYDAQLDFVDSALPQRMTAYEFLEQEKPLPSIPSPTLTNPDMVLPAFVDLPSLPSPPRSDIRPPSPSYLRKPTSPDVQARPPKKEKRGLMSRKMLLLRSRTGSHGSANSTSQQSILRSVTSGSDIGSIRNSTYASSPTLMDVGNLAPPRRASQDTRASTGSSFNSDELAAIPSFLAKYEHVDDPSTDDDTVDGESPATQKYGYSVHIEGGLDAQRKRQEEEEQTSALLSKRAEQILANAKKRLNLMEGNLRGARDLVAPLTAANLKRATSLGSSHHRPFRDRDLLTSDVDQPDDDSVQHPVRTLHAQASSPTMGYGANGHMRGYSDVEVLERPHTALAQSSPSTLGSTRIPVRTGDGSWNHLRGSKSYDSLGSIPVRGSPLHVMGSPDSNLTPLVEDEGSQASPSARNSTIAPASSHSNHHAGLGIFRPASRTDDLREQMSSLKGKISSLKERAREDSLRRQSLQNLRTPSPFNNATFTPPEFFYTQSESYGSPVLDTNAGVGRTSQNNSPATPVSMQKLWGTQPVVIGSRNAFAEQAAAAQKAKEEEERRQRQFQDSVAYKQQQHQHQQHHQNDQARAPFPERTASTKGRRTPVMADAHVASVPHRRTPSGTAIVGPAASRYSHHQLSPRMDMPGSYAASETDDELSPGVEYEEYDVSPLAPGDMGPPDYDHVVSEEEGSVYEDAKLEQPTVVAHEDRDDAFDYEHFFLHSAMGSYSNGHRNSYSSDETASSTETARGPTAGADQANDEELFNPVSNLYPPPTPETPERLREIERNLHHRTLSNESVDTIATFATANEGLGSPTERPRQTPPLEWPIVTTALPMTNGAHSRSNSRPTSRPNSRPGTAIRRTDPIRDDNSDRADSGVGGLSNGHSTRPGSKRSTVAPLTPRSPTTAAAAATNGAKSPPASPSHFGDPVKVAVSALLDPDGRNLGLKDKAIVFGLVESLRLVVRRLQEEDVEGQYESRVLRRRLDEAKRALDGVA